VVPSGAASPAAALTESQPQDRTGQDFDTNSNPRPDPQADPTLRATLDPQVRPHCGPKDSLDSKKT
jgi:hypothetical protein